MEPKVRMLQTCHITSPTGLQWWRSCRAPSTYFPTPDPTFDGSGTRTASPERRAGRPSTGLCWPSEQKAFPGKCYSNAIYFDSVPEFNAFLLLYTRISLKIVKSFFQLVTREFNITFWWNKVAPWCSSKKKTPYCYIFFEL